MSTREHKNKIWNIIKNIEVCMLTTQTDDGAMRARPMQLVQKEYDNKLWFFTNGDTGKVEELLGDRDVCVTFASPSTSTYVSMSGRANITKDQKLINSLWTDEVTKWLSGDKGRDACSVIEVKIEHGEHWDYSEEKTFDKPARDTNVWQINSSSKVSYENEKF